jgi:hypothetical protein
MSKEMEPLGYWLLSMWCSCYHFATEVFEPASNGGDYKVFHLKAYFAMKGIDDP